MLMLVTVYPFINPLALIQLRALSICTAFFYYVKNRQKNIFFIAIDCGNRSHQPTIVKSRTAMANNNWQSKINLPEMFTLSVRPFVGWINYRQFKGSWKSSDRQRSDKIAKWDDPIRNESQPVLCVAAKLNSCLSSAIIKAHAGTTRKSSSRTFTMNTIKSGNYLWRSVLFVDVVISIGCVDLCFR